jgi:hypothetical protein
MVDVRTVTIHKRLLEASAQEENLKTITDILDEKTCKMLRNRYWKAKHKYLIYANTKLIAESDDINNIAGRISFYLRHQGGSIVVIEKETEKVFGCFYGFIR